MTIKPESTAGFDAFLKTLAENNASLHGVKLLGSKQGEWAGFLTAEQIAQIVAHVPNLEELFVSGVTFENVRKAGTVATSMMACCNLESVTIASCHMPNGCFAPLANALAKSLCLANLAIKSTPINSRDAACVGAIIAECSSLEMLDLSDDQLDDECLTIIASALPRSTRLRSLNLVFNKDITNEGMGALYEAACKTEHLEQVIINQFMQDFPEGVKLGALLRERAEKRGKV